MKKYVLVTLVALSTLGLGSCCRFLDCCFEDPCNPCEMFQGCSDSNNCSLSSKKECKKVEKSCENSNAPACPNKSACSSADPQSSCTYTPSCQPCQPCAKPCKPCAKPCDPCENGKKGFSFFRKNKSNNSGSCNPAPESSSKSDSSSNSCSACPSAGKCSSGNS